jgi:hypothetical protein
MIEDWEPQELGPRGLALWTSITARYSLRPDELAILADAAHEADVIEMLKAEFQARELITTGSMGQDVAAPHVSEIRQHRSTLATLLGKLRLPDEGAGANNSAAGRALVSARWHPKSS